MCSAEWGSPGQRERLFNGKPGRAVEKVTEKLRGATRDMM